MFLMLVVGYLSLINVFTKNTASKKFYVYSFIYKSQFEKNILEEKNCKQVKKIIIKETKERTLKFELREYRISSNKPPRR